MLNFTFRKTAAVHEPADLQQNKTVYKIVIDSMALT